MKYTKRTWQHKLASALTARRIKFKMVRSMFSTEFGDLIFDPHRLCIRFAGHEGINATFRYNDNPDIGQIIKLLTNTPSVKKSIEAKKRQESRMKWTWATLGFVFIAGCSYAVTSMDLLSQFIERSVSQGGRTIASSALLKQMTDRDESVKNGVIKALNINTDLNRALNEMELYAAIQQPNKPIDYTFDEGTWLHENLIHISKLSQHHIVYDTNTTFRINHKIIESGRGSDIARKAFHAIHSQFDGKLMLVQCKNTSIITDKKEYTGLCS